MKDKGFCPPAEETEAMLPRSLPLALAGVLQMG